MNDLTNMTFDELVAEVQAARAALHHENSQEAYEWALWRWRPYPTDLSIAKCRARLRAAEEELERRGIIRHF